MTPRGRIEVECERVGRAVVIERCARLIAGGTADPGFTVVLGGPHGVRLLEDGVPPGQAYWLRVWATRGLLWAGPGEHASVLRLALEDDAWRVREMACKAISRHRVGALLADVAALADDPVARVRTAAARAVTQVADDLA